MTASENELLLYGVFQELVARKMPLSVSDYLDVLRAIEGGSVYRLPRFLHGTFPAAADFGYAVSILPAPVNSPAP